MSGNLIKMEMEELSISVPGLAEAMDVPYDQARDWLRGKSAAPLLFYVALHMIGGIDLVKAHLLRAVEAGVYKRPMKARRWDV